MPSGTDEGSSKHRSNTPEEPQHSKPFRFKRTNRDSTNYHADPRSRHERHHHRTKRRKTAPYVDDDPSAYDDLASDLPPDTAFRESLFDALGDDEGAAFWQGVYGQPIHTYPNQVRDAETGELEQMNDDDYAQYVRRKMWEKSREGVEAAREEQRRRKEAERKTAGQHTSSTNVHSIPEEGDFVFDIEFERSLERGKRRRDKKHREQLWKNYSRQWEELQKLYEAHKTPDADMEQFFLRNKIAWPVESGKRKDVSPVEIEKFFRDCAGLGDEVHDAATLLKLERIRWHPDKIQQRYGFMHIDESTLQGVTAVFQVLDNLWRDYRSKQT